MALMTSLSELTLSLSVSEDRLKKQCTHIPHEKNKTQKWNEKYKIKNKRAIN